MNSTNQIAQVSVLSFDNTYHFLRNGVVMDVRALEHLESSGTKIIMSVH